MIRTLDPILDKPKLSFALLASVYHWWSLLILLLNTGLCTIQTWDEKVSSVAANKPSPYFLQLNIPVGEISRSQKKAYVVNCVNEQKALFRITMNCLSLPRLFFQTLKLQNFMKLLSIHSCFIYLIIHIVPAAYKKIFPQAWQRTSSAIKLAATKDPQRDPNKALNIVQLTT